MRGSSLRSVALRWQNLQRWKVYHPARFRRTDPADDLRADRKHSLASERVHPNPAKLLTVVSLLWREILVANRLRSLGVEICQNILAKILHL